MKKNFTFLFLFFVAVIAFAQQDAQFSQNMFNNMDINPGYAGSNEAICATLLARQQWVGFKDPQGDKGWPQTYLLSVDGPVSRIHGGLGMTIIQDQLGFEKNLGVKLSYAYRLHAGPGTLGIGAQVGFFNEKMDFSKFIPLDQGDQLLTGSGVKGNMGTDFAAGLFYKIPSKLYFGISADQLREASINLGTTPTTLDRHYYITAGYYWAIPGSPTLELDPSFLIKSDLTSTQYDLNCLLKYNNQFWGGLSYRPGDAVAVLLGMNWKDFHFGYSYDITTSALNKYSSGTHEIMLGYCFKVVHEFKPESYKNPRFL